MRFCGQINYAIFVAREHFDGTRESSWVRKIVAHSPLTALHDVAMTTMHRSSNDRVKATNFVAIAES